ncbi:TIGR02680 family protein [Actinorhabdospora filicis]|uniref:TIGR02680 family protein n=1 Tax=Actinorhabdospora filicis TaxID=1785913 RepID=A0A9W6SNG2_9ACTN|nr:TIGR02680 family protein [Actinorhabdospora filicis]GLZ79443.1 TIGR02680 family protein [Actinorhabdospora filicis]
MRLGLVDMFYYDQQEFWFRDGRMMLLGNNGTGKSKVLALTLPFLLDGDTRPYRVEPDGDPKKQMHWNLLLGGKYTDRLGYTWMEFGRVDEQGRQEYATIGIGLKAVAGPGIADKWFFVTSQRLGAGGLELAPNGTALTRDGLTEAIGTNGQVVRAAATYRRLVDDKLFHLGEDRYSSLVDLLVQLRQPQLSKKPDEKKLSAALTDALAPVDQDILADVADAFHQQGEQRDQLSGLMQAADATRDFDRRYRRYARVAARRQAAGLRETQSAYEKHGRDIAALGDTISEADRACTEAEEQRNGLGKSILVDEARQRELSGRAELSDIKGAQETLSATRGAHRIAEEAARAADREHRTWKRRLDEAGDRVAASSGRAAKALADSTGLAHGALVADRHRDLTASFTDLTRTSDPTTARRGGEAIAAHQDRAVEHVLALHVEAEARAVEKANASATLVDRESQRDAAADRVTTATDIVETARREHVAAWRGFHPAEFAVPDPDVLGLVDWTETLHGPNPAAEAAVASARAAHSALTEQRLRTEAEMTAAQARRGVLLAERAELASGGIREPALSAVRVPGREGRAGAPLWRIVDFHDHVPEAARAALEAAMEATGLLDAWLFPDGTLLAAGVLDDALTPGSAEHTNATGVLRPALGEDHGELTEETVGALLRAIGLGSGRTWIAADGRYRIGPRYGRAAKPSAEYLGHAAREQARRRRLGEIETELSTIEVEIFVGHSRLEDLREHTAALDSELRGAPSDQALRDAHAGAAHSHAELHARQENVAEAQERLRERDEAHRAAIVSRDDVAADLGLPVDADELKAVRAAVHLYRSALGELWSAILSHGECLRAVEDCQEELVGAVERLEHVTTILQDSEGELHQAEARLEALQDRLGGTIADLRAEIEVLGIAIGRKRTERAAADKRFQDQKTILDRAQSKRDTLIDLQHDAANERDRAVSELRDFTATGLLSVAAPEIESPDPGQEWAVAPAIQLARRTDEALSDVDYTESAWSRVERDIVPAFTTFADILSRHGMHASNTLQHGCIVVTVVHQANTPSPGELEALLRADIDHRNRLLTEKERELLEEHLVKEVGQHIQTRIHTAEQQVTDMNAELTNRPTSTGMRLRLLWGPAKDAPEGFARARAVLRKDNELWTPSDEERVSEFLHERIRQEAAARPEGTWLEHLRNALDYRRWHRFTIEKHQGGGWVAAVGPASGGERVLTVSLPLFAAASSHYRSAHEHAPRLIMLDEAFAGVDDDARAKCLGLLAAFDLDVVMTSEREWGFYATVPGIRTHQLVRREGVDAVFVSVFEWDGRRSARVPATSGLPPAESGEPPTTQPTLM